MNTKNTLKSMRVKKGLSQEEASKIMKVSRQTYQSYESNPLTCPIDTLLSIIELLDGNIEEFLFAIKQDYMSYNNKPTKED